MVSCSISNCGNGSSNCNLSTNGITFHRFPQDPDIKEKWISATGKKNWFPSSYSRICSCHFKEEDFNISTQRRTLFKTAVPSLNIWKLVNTMKKSSEASVDSPSTSHADSYCLSTAGLDPNSTEEGGELGEEDEPNITKMNPKRVQSLVEHQKRVIIKQRCKIKTLQSRVRRYRKTILTLKDLIKKKLPGI